MSKTSVRVLIGLAVGWMLVGLWWSFYQPWVGIAVVVVGLGQLILTLRRASGH